LEQQENVNMRISTQHTHPPITFFSFALLVFATLLVCRYADVIVHRLLQATLKGSEAVENFPMIIETIGSICGDCNTKKNGS
jgi:exoribonuclease II